MQDVLAEAIAHMQEECEQRGNRAQLDEALDLLRTHNKLAVPSSSDQGACTPTPTPSDCCRPHAHGNLSIRG